MDSKENVIKDLSEVFGRWQVLLAGLSEEQIHTPLVPSSWTVKDVVAHLWSWQQASVSRAEAALHNRQPEYPRWWQILGPDPDEDVDRTNAWLYEASRGKLWKDTYGDWETQFRHYLELVGRVPEKDFFQPGRFVWMGKYALADSVNGSLDHHREHYDSLTTWLMEHGGLKGNV